MSDLTFEDYKDSYTIRHGRIQDPGKFEGEPWYTAFYYDKTMNGEEEVWDVGDGSSISFVRVSEDEQSLHKDLNGAENVVLYESTVGFVHAEVVYSEDDLDSRLEAVGWGMQEQD